MFLQKHFILQKEDKSNYLSKNVVRIENKLMFKKSCYM